MNKLFIEDFNYNLPDGLIAKYPLGQRDQSKLLVWKNKRIQDEVFTTLPDLLPKDSMLVFNNTRVISARLLFKKPTGAVIEIFILEPHTPADYALNFLQTAECCWHCVIGNLKKWKEGTLTSTLVINNIPVILSAENLGGSSESKVVSFSWNNNHITFSEILEAAGKIPIPPYLHRDSEESDITRYQTIYSKIKGSVAAPTAGLHFTEPVLKSLAEHGIKTAETTLHVGAGTFQPVKTVSVSDHEMHTEHIVVYRDLIEQLVHHQGPIIAVGTTSVRTLESIYRIGCKLHINPYIGMGELTVGQWEPYTGGNEISKTDALKAILEYMEQKNLTQFNTATQIIIVPGYTFKIVDGLITNFHQPKSTLLLLISAFVGDEWKTIYKHALENNYRFLSYGDSNLYL